MTADQRELFNERAAIYEYEAGLSREEAERRARVEVTGRDGMLVYRLAGDEPVSEPPTA